MSNRARLMHRPRFNERAADQRQQPSEEWAPTTDPPFRKRAWPGGLDQTLRPIHALANEIHAVVNAAEELLRRTDLLLACVATIIAEAPPPRGRTMRVSYRRAERLSQTVVLIYELLDAHDDTAQLMGELARDSNFQARLDWQAHLEYLRALQRTGRDVLARIALEDLTYELADRTNRPASERTRFSTALLSHRRA